MCREKTCGTRLKPFERFSKNKEPLGEGLHPTRLWSGGERMVEGFYYIFTLLSRL